MRFDRIVVAAGAALVGAAVAKELGKAPADREWHGDLGGFVPYDFRIPTLSRVRDRWWNPGDDRLFTPHVFGVGWSVNLARLTRCST